MPGQAKPGLAWPGLARRSLFLLLTFIYRYFVSVLTDSFESWFGRFWNKAEMASTHTRGRRAGLRQRERLTHTGCSNVGKTVDLLLLEMLPSMSCDVS